MKKPSMHPLKFAGLLAALALVMSMGCGKKGDKAVSGGGVVSAEKNSFKDVAAHLDTGGDFYMYLGTERVLDGISQNISGYRRMIQAIPDMKEEDRANANKGFDVVTRLVKSSGIEEISGVGISSIAREKGLYYSKFMVHHYKGRNTGYLWTFLGKSTHPLASLDLLPASTALAWFCDADVPLMWSTFQKEATAAEVPQLDEALRTMPAKLEQATGIKLDQFLGSFGGEVGIVITLDESKKVSFPMGGGQPQEFPEPGLMLVAKVKDDTIFNLVEQKMAGNPQVIKVDKDGLRMRTLPLLMPLPMQLRPTVARSGDYLFIATTDALIQEALAVKSGQKKGFKASDEFKRLSQGVPQQGNGFYFMSKTFGQTVSKIQLAAMQSSSKKDPAQAQLFQSFVDPNNAPFHYGVFGNTDEGWLTVGNGNQDPGKVLLAQATVFPIAMMAGIAVPSFVRARQRAQASTVLNEARQMDAAKDQYALENNKTGTVQPSFNDLTPYLKSGSKLATNGGSDSLGNAFLINDIQSRLAVSATTKYTLSAATGGDTFWGPYS